jgi:hypothetical protein
MKKNNHHLFVIVILAAILLPTVLSTISQAEESWLNKLLRYTGISATPSTLKGSCQAIDSGVIYIAQTKNRFKERLTGEGGWRSPIFAPDDKSILAMQGDKLISISLNNKGKKTLYTVPDLLKLIGFSKSDPDSLLVLKEDKEGRVGTALFSLQNGDIIPLPFDRKSRDNRRLLIHLKSWDRDYGETKVSVKCEAEQGMLANRQWSDVYISLGSRSLLNISNCEASDCGQPSLSHDGQQLVFINSLD